LPIFDVDHAPGEPATLFLEWLRGAIEAGVPEPHAMTLATADALGVPSSRVLICKDVTSDGSWFFASSALSRKCRELSVNAHAALSFYWPQQGRQIRIQGIVRACPADRSAADFRARPDGSRAEALVGRQSQVLTDPEDLPDAVAAARDRLAADPTIVAPDWTLYELAARGVEFWQADRERRHVRLWYCRSGIGWIRERLWP
jgi:pyridoxamine 5'-phosphate oxidase